MSDTTFGSPARSTMRPDRHSSRQSLRRENRDAAKYIKRVFMGWERPLLHSAIAHFGNRYVKNQCWDMDHVMVVLPSSLAASRLQQMMAIAAKEQGLLLRPPQVFTFGDLPEKLYKAKFPFASELQQTMAWIDALKNCSADQLGPLLLLPPTQEQSEGWMELAGMLSSLHRELSSDLTMFSDVIELLADDTDEKRWTVLADLQNRYLDRLSEQKLWDIQTSRRFALEWHEVAVPDHCEVVMLGTVDLNRAQRYYLDAIGPAVTILIGAPESWADGFDAYGALISDFWQDICIDIPRNVMVCRSTSDEVAECVASLVGQLSSSYSAQEITIGLPEPDIMPPLVERLQRSGVATRSAAGIPASQTKHVRLLQMIGEFLSSGRFDDFAALVRTPSVERLLRLDPGIPEGYISALDTYYRNTLISSVRVADIPNRESADVFLKTLAVVDQWLKPLRVDRAPLQGWAVAIRQVFEFVAGPSELDLDSEHESAEFKSMALLGSVLTQIQDLPPDLTLNVTLGEAIAWIVRELERERIVPLNDPQAIEMLGWLELTLDDAPVLLLTGVHDGRVPESVNGDPFLPNAVRTRLGLLDNARRYARDCYALQVMLHSREQMRILTNHYDSDGSPQTPSRLLLAVQPDDLAERIISILKPNGSSTVGTLRKSWTPVVGQTWVPVPPPDPTLGVTLEKFSATDLADYLYCPYRFYLKKLCRVRQVNDDLYELEANTFGDLIHNCVCTLKDSPAEASHDAEVIRKWLFARLKDDAERLFGKLPAPAVRVQIEQARLRLAKFSELQAQRNRDGWRIWATEIDVKLEHQVTRQIDGATVYFHGRIDRIDYHPVRDVYAVWDYKTSDNPKKPVAAHFSYGKWKQLQLPLYRHLVRGLGVQRLESVGYINLPKAIDQVVFEVAEFEPAVLEEADLKIEEVVRSIRNGMFWPPNYDDIFPNDEWQAVTQHNIARRWEAPESLDQILENGINDPNAEPEFIRSITKFTPPKNDEPHVRARRHSLPSTRQTTSRPKRITPLLDNTTGRIPTSWYSSKLIRASAGSGKTYQLAQRVIQLLFAGESVDSILATTFTRKAAGEILERVLTFIADAILDKGSFSRLQEMIKPRVITMQSCKYHLARLCSDLHRLRISTLDSFYNELARNFSLELSLPPGWRLADPYEERKLQAIAIGRLFSVIDQDQMQSLISQLCKGEAVRGVWREVASTIEAGYPIYLSTVRQSWMQSFGQSAPSEQRVTEAIEAIRASQCNDKRYDAAKNKLIEAFFGGDRAELLNHLLVERARERDLQYFNKEITPDISHDILTLVNATLNQEFRVLEQQNASAYELLANFHTQLDYSKRRERILTFADISLRLSEWMQKKLHSATAHPERVMDDEGNMVELLPIHQRLDSSIKHLLLDEFQDTSPDQWKILQPFALDVFVNDSLRAQKSSIFCVGDVKQAIYGWRGGVAELFDLIAKQLVGIQNDTLAKSYRSSPIVINFVNEVFANLSKHENYGQGKPAVAFWIDGFETHQTEKTNVKGYVQIYNGPAKKNGRAEEEDEQEDDITLYDQCVKDIEELTLMAPKKSIGVLVRTNAEVGHMINLLRERSIDASQEGGNPLTDSSPVDLILSLVSLADHPGDGVAYFHVTHASPQAFLEQIPGPLSPTALSNWVRQQFDRDGYADSISKFASILAEVCNERDQLRLEQLIQLAYQYERIETPRLKDFIDYVQTQKISLPKVSTVRVMTIHQSKGLEFDAVFLPNLSRRFVTRQSPFVVRTADSVSMPDGVTRRVGGHLQQYLSKDWQLAFEKDAISRLQDSLCNFYVAITRARQALYIYASPSKAPLQQWDSVLHSIFASDQREAQQEVIYSSGRPDWYVERDEAAWPQTLFPLDDVRESGSNLPEIVLHQDFFSIDSPRKNRQLPGLRPSMASEARLVPLRRALEPAATFGNVAGTVVHRWFEDIQWIEGYEFDRQRAIEQALDILTPEQMPLIHLDEWVEKFERYLQNPGVREVLSQEQYQLEKLRAATGRNLQLTIQNERRILELVDGMLLRGTIDRLVLVEDESHVVAAEIIDYKTDFFELFPSGTNLGQWIEVKKQRHRQQLLMYRDSISRMYRLPKERITMTLMLLSADVVVPIDD